MKTFTIDSDNNISVFASKKETAAASTPFDPFTSQSELAELAAEWPMSRLVEIWNSIPGVTAVSKFTSKKIAMERIWKAIQNLGTDIPKPADVPEPVATEVALAETTSIPETAEAPASEETGTDEVAAQATLDSPVAPANDEPAPAETLATVGAQVPEVAPVPPQATTKPTRSKKAPKAPKNPTEAKPGGVREGSKTATVIALLKREGGATLEEIMQQMGWQKHTVRGFMAGAMKKAGFTVESFKAADGARTYRIAQ